MLVLVIVISFAPFYTKGNTTIFEGFIETATSWVWGTASDDYLSVGYKEISSTSILFNAGLANLPQLFFSIAYLNINTICTAVAGAHEWNQLATIKKHLRVTKPFGQQRSTYFLQLPYRWSLPLISAGGILHWLLSQTFFLVRIDFFDLHPLGHQNIVSTESRCACGLSALCLMVFIGVALLLLAAIGAIGLSKMPTRMPIAASCSLAISAACHHPPEESIRNCRYCNGAWWEITKETTARSPPRTSHSR